MPFNQYHPYYYPVIAGAAVLSVVLYWFLWKKNARLANWLVFGILSGLIVYLVNWDYQLRDYFVIKSWRLP